MNIFLKCPGCGVEVGLVAAAGLEDKQVECPRCHRKSLVRDLLPKRSLKVGTHNYQLRLGSQWIGRLTAGNDAELQIPDSNHFMSRRHDLITLSCAADGLRCTFEEHGKNPTSMQGIKLIEDDIIYLNVNDCLMLGDTKMYLAEEYGKGI